MTNNTYTLSRREIDKALRTAAREIRQYPSGWYVAIAAKPDRKRGLTQLVIDTHAVTASTVIRWSTPLIPVLDVYSKHYTDREYQEQEILTNLRERGLDCQLVA